MGSDLVQRLVSMHSRHRCWDLCSQSVLDTGIAGTSIMTGTQLPAVGVLRPRVHHAPAVADVGLVKYLQKEIIDSNI